MSTTEPRADLPGARERFTREARSLASIESNHVVRVFDFGVEDASPYLVMELLIGEDHLGSPRNDAPGLMGVSSSPSD